MQSPPGGCCRGPPLRERSAAAGCPVDIRIPIIPLDGPLPDRGVRLPAERATDLMLGLDAVVSVRGTDGAEQPGKGTYIGDEGMEITYTDAT